MDEWLTVKELSKYLKISSDTIYRFAQKDRIPASKIGRQWRFNKEKIDGWLQGRDKKKKK